MFLIILITSDIYEYAVTHTRILIGTENEEIAIRFCKENSDEYDSLNNIYKITSTFREIDLGDDKVVVCEDEHGELIIEKIKILI